MTRAGALCALLLVGNVWAGDLPRARPEEVGLSSKRLEYIDQFYAARVSKGEMAGIVTLVARHGKIAHFSAMGYADIEHKKKMTEDSIFRLYSMTKPIAAAALLMLYEQGLFQMDDPVSKYIPAFASLRVLRRPDSLLGDTVPLERPATIEDLLRHTAGFTHCTGPTLIDEQCDKVNVFGRDVSLTEMMSRLAKIPLESQPGTKFSYSIAPDIQARLVEILSGLPFDEFLERNLFKPLGMHDSGFYVPPDKASRLANIYQVKDGKLTLPEKCQPARACDTVFSLDSNTVPHKHHGGSLGLAGTAADYWRFAQMLLNGGQLDGVRILSPQVVQFMTRDHLGSIKFPDAKLSGVFSPSAAQGFGFGLGVAVVKDPAAAGFMSSEGTYFWMGALGTVSGLILDRT